MTLDTGQLLAFVTAVFDGVELARVPLEDGSIGHAEIRVSDTILLAQATLDRELSGRMDANISRPMPACTCSAWRSGPVRRTVLRDSATDHTMERPRQCDE